MAFWHSSRARRDGRRDRIRCPHAPLLGRSRVSADRIERPAGRTPKKAKIWQNSIAAIDRDMDWLFMPAVAALTGDVLSVLWSAVLWLRRAVARYGA
jgi:hypothetical protein